MIIHEQIPLLEEILSRWEAVIGDEYIGYKSHVYRMIHFCLALKDCDEFEREKIIIAGAFHDIGIWIKDTVDYIPPAIPPAMEYFKERNLTAWSTEITLMISEHHKMHEYKHDSYHLVKMFRKGDLVDFSFGFFSFGIPKSFIDVVKRQFPNADFYKNLGRRAVKWFIRNPLNPAPMIKW